MPYQTNGVRNYKKEYREYHAKEDSKADRAMRNKGRRMLERAGLVHKGDDKDVDHRTALSKGGSSDRSNLRAVSKHSNRSFARTKSGRMK